MRDRMNLYFSSELLTAFGPGRSQEALSVCDRGSGCNFVSKARRRPTHRLDRPLREMQRLERDVGLPAESLLSSSAFG